MTTKKNAMLYDEMTAWIAAFLKRTNPIDAEKAVKMVLGRDLDAAYKQWGTEGVQMMFLDKVMFNKPSWLKRGNELADFENGCQCGRDVIFAALGKDRTLWPANRDECREIVDAYKVAHLTLEHEKPQTSALMAPVNEAVAGALDNAPPGAPEVAALNKAKLDYWFPRGNQEAEPPIQKWIDDEAQRGKFFKAVNNRFNKYKVSTDHKERLALIHSWLSSELHETRYTEVEAEELVLNAIELEYGSRNSSKPAETSTPPLAPSDKSISDAPAKPVEAPTNDALPAPAIPLPAPLETVAKNGAKEETEKPAETLALVPFDPMRAIQKVQASSDLMRAMRQTVLKEGIDFGAIPGTEKKTLLKPGAEKLCNAFSLCPVFEDVDKVERWDTDKPLFHYRVRCKLVDIATGAIVATGIGSCNSMESKYRQRWVFQSDLKDLGMKPEDFKPNQRRERKSQKTGKPYVQYAIENADPFSLVNTIDKMAQKRALIAAVLIGTNASEYYTQDVESLRDFGYIDAEIVEG